MFAGLRNWLFGKPVEHCVSPGPQITVGFPHEFARRMAELNRVAKEQKEKPTAPGIQILRGT